MHIPCQFISKFMRISVPVVLLLMLTGCSTNASGTSYTPPTKKTPASPAGKLTEFLIPSANSFPIGITSGPDGNLWFTERGKIGRITPGGQITEFSIPTANSDPVMITSGPDGNLWFTETTWAGPNITSRIGRITPTGTVTEFSIPNANSYSQGGGGYLYGTGFGPIAITNGPDGNLWFTGIFGKGKVGRSTPGGTITEFSLSSANSVSYGITTGPDGNLWFTGSGNQIGRITTGK